MTQRIAHHCPHCDAVIDPSATFCDQCGNTLPAVGATQLLPPVRPSGSRRSPLRWLITVALFGIILGLVGVVWSRVSQTTTVIMIATDSVLSTVPVTETPVTSACLVPNVIGQDQSAAEGLVAGTKLQSVITTAYDSNVPAGKVVSQDPPSGTKLDPCQGEVTMVVSFGTVSQPTLPPMTSATPNALSPMPIATISPASPTDLVAYYTFDDGTARDGSTYRNNGEIYGSPQMASGIKGHALVFKGFSQPEYVIINNSPTLAVYDNFTFSIWFNVQGNVSMDAYGKVSNCGYQFFMSKSGDKKGASLFVKCLPEDNSWHLFVVSGSGTYEDYTSGRGIIGSDAGFSPNGWHMATVTHDYENVKLYLDGALQGNRTASEFNLNPSNAIEPLIIGIGTDRTWHPFNGMLDEVRVYNRALSENEVQQLYMQSRP